MPANGRWDLIRRLKFNILYLVRCFQFLLCITFSGIFENDVKCPLTRVALSPYDFQSFWPMHINVGTGDQRERVRCNNYPLKFCGPVPPLFEFLEYNSTCHCYLGCGILLLLP